MNSSIRTGVYLAIFAYSFWAVSPIYFKVMAEIAPFELLAHRVIWSFLLTLPIISLSGRMSALKSALHNTKSLKYLIITTLLIGANWAIYIWAINANRMLSASLGYYINPLIYILLGLLFFQEKLTHTQKFAAALCLLAVGFEVVQFGRLPYIALGLAITFGLYGMVRKKLGIDSLIGMALETGLMLPLAVIYLWVSDSPTTALFQNEWSLNGLLFLAGPVTMIPLLCFAAAANRISMTALGFFQYIGPSGMFLLAIVIYNEPLSPSRLITFSIVWFALVLLVAQKLHQLRNTTPTKGYSL